MKILFWNVDTQNDFINPDGKLYVKGAEQLKPYLQTLTDYAKEQRFQVINTADLHNEDSRELSDEPDFKITFPKHCMENTEGAKFIKETDPENPYVIHYNDFFVTTKGLNSIRNIVLYKDGVDVFESNRNAEFVVKTTKPDIVVVYGVASNVCVDRAIRGLRRLGMNVLVVKDAIQSLPDTNEEELYKEWKKIGASFTTVREVTDIEVKKPVKEQPKVEEKPQEEPKETEPIKETPKEEPKKEEYPTPEETPKEEAPKEEVPEEPEKKETKE